MIADKAIFPVPGATVHQLESEQQCSGCDCDPARSCAKQYRDGRHEHEHYQQGQREIARLDPWLTLRSQLLIRAPCVGKEAATPHAGQRGDRELRQRWERQRHSGPTERQTTENQQQHPS